MNLDDEEIECMLDEDLGPRDEPAWATAEEIDAAIPVHCVCGAPPPDCVCGDVYDPF